MVVHRISSWLSAMGSDWNINVKGVEGMFIVQLVQASRNPGASEWASISGR